MSENSLRQLRRAAGYSSAKIFADIVGIPQPTYARYEQIPDGPDTSIPIKNAWCIADKLGCSIDEVVGREEPNLEEVHGDIQAAFNMLSPASKDELIHYLGYLFYCDEKELEREKIQEDTKYAVLVRQLEDEFATQESQNPFRFQTPQQRRAAFEAFAIEKAEEAEEEGESSAEQKKHVKGVMQKVMKAYDEAHPEARKSDAVVYEIVKLKES